MRPKIVLADEPTGNLDSKTSVEIMGLIQELSSSGITVVLVTHEPNIAEYASRVIVLKDGRLLSDEPHIQIANHALAAAQIQEAI
jgi:putative ABC transport system ATP-binding protein